MSEATLPILDVQPVLSFTTTCYCGWVSSGHQSEAAGKDAALMHLLHSRCAVCYCDLATCWPDAGTGGPDAQPVLVLEHPSRGTDVETLCAPCAA